VRESYVMRHGKLVPKSEAAPLNRGFFNVMPDIKPFVTQDGKEITSRSALRAYEQATGTKQIGNDMASLHKQLRAQVYGEN
jgi:hypothetical protein